MSFCLEFPLDFTYFEYTNSLFMQKPYTLPTVLRILFLIASFWFNQIIQAQNLNVTLLDQVSYGNEDLSNICGWKDPQDGKEYALVGAANGLSIVDVTNPSNATIVVQIPGPACTWREIKTNGNYAYVTTECGQIGLQIVDLTNLPATNLQTATWTPTINNTKLNTIHALHIDNGKVYLYGSNVGNKGAIIADITTNPMAPVYLGRYDLKYVHDGYVRNDTLYAGHIYDGECAIVNCANPTNPVSLDVFTTPTNFTHNTWLSTDSRYCFTTDENNDSYLAAYDVTIGNITEVDRIQSNPGSNSVVHNTHIIRVAGNDYAVTSWYKDGFTIVDVGRPHNMVQVGNYDTAPTASGSGMNNCWGVYPYLPSGTIVASDMTNGLFVCGPTYVRACYIEGTVIDCNNNQPLSGVTVQIQNPGPSTNSATDVTDALGNYGVGVAAAGTYTVTFTKAGYTTQTFVVSVTNGNVTLQNVTLCGPTPPFSYTGMVIDAFTMTPIAGANVRIKDASYQWDTVTNASGNFTIPAMFAGTYDITAGKWGHVTRCFANQTITSSSGPVTIPLNPGYYDDFTWNWNWTESGSATDGAFVRGEPLGTMNSSVQANPDFDVSSDCSVEAYVTGNTGTTASDDDLDGGSSSIVSPVFNLTGYVQPYLYFSTWHYFNAGGPSDSLRVMIANGTTSVLVDEWGSSSPNSSMWQNHAYDISSLLTPSATMSIRVRARENTNGHISECGFDKFYILDSATVGVNNHSATGNVIVYPNPMTNYANIICPDLQGSAELIVTDIFGRIVQTMTISETHSRISRNELKSGVYLYQLISGDRPLASGKIIVQ